MSAFYSDEVKALRRKVKAKRSGGNALKEATKLELDRCAKWITDNNFKNIGLQFPDSFLDDSFDVFGELALKTKTNVFVLSDTSFGSCCIDDVTGDHGDADAIIHFGHACLSLKHKLPVLYIFEKCSIEVSRVVNAFKDTFPDKTHPVILYYEVNYYHAISKIAENLKEYENLVVSELLYPDENGETTLNDNQVKIIRNQRYFVLPKTRNLEDYTIFYIGCRYTALTNVMLSFNKCKFHMYDTVDRYVVDDTFNATRFFLKRNYYIEKARDARIIGILIGAVGVSNYVSTIKRLRQAIYAANKRSYVFGLGKINVAKLANFVEVEIFVNVACLESAIVDCNGYYQPIITPYELEIALNMREFTDRFITDFAELLPDSDYHVPVRKINQETDVSLITGKTRTLGLSDDSDEDKDESNALVQREKMIVSEIHKGASGEFLCHSSWKGLEQKLGETLAADIQKGQKGIASEYEGERTVQ